VLNGELSDYTYEDYHIHSVFGVAQPRSCSGVPDSVLSPRATWNNDEAYYKTAFKLSNAFRVNFKKFEDYASEETRRGGPQRYAF
jgi:phosphoenolpyruvate carboxykinase (ATP)